jgi:hypothetical protein
MRGSNALFKRLQNFPAYSSSDESVIKIETNMGDWWNDTDGGKR